MTLKHFGNAQAHYGGTHRILNVSASVQNLIYPAALLLCHKGKGNRQIDLESNLFDCKEPSVIKQKNLFPPKCKDLFFPPLKRRGGEFLTAKKKSLHRIS